MTQNMLTKSFKPKQTGNDWNLLNALKKNLRRGAVLGQEPHSTDICVSLKCHSILWRRSSKTGIRPRDAGNDFNSNSLMCVITWKRGTCSNTPRQRHVGFSSFSCLFSSPGSPTTALRPLNSLSYPFLLQLQIFCSILCTSWAPEPNQTKEFPLCPLRTPSNSKRHNRLI